MRILGRAWLLVMTLSLPHVAWGFMPGPDLIRECPKCKAQVVEQTMASGNTFGARSWTDGKMEAPMWPDHPWLVKCPKCAYLFWISDASEVGERTIPEMVSGKGRWQAAVNPDTPSEADLLAFLRSNNLPKDKELYVRRRVWWAANDAIRDDPDAKTTLSSAQQKNLQALAGLLNEEDSSNRIEKAELLRELGKFDDCSHLLQKPFADEDHARAAAFIKALAGQKIQVVREIETDETRKRSKSPKQPRTPAAPSSQHS